MKGKQRSSLFKVGIVTIIVFFAFNGLIYITLKVLEGALPRVDDCLSLDEKHPISLLSQGNGSLGSARVYGTLDRIS